MEKSLWNLAYCPGWASSEFTSICDNLGTLMRHQDTRISGQPSCITLTRKMEANIKGKILKEKSGKCVTVKFKINFPFIKFYVICVMCVSRSVISDSLWPHRLSPARLLCPCNSPGKNTGVDCHSLLQRNFPTQGSNSGLLHHRQILYHLSFREVCFIKF